VNNEIEQLLNERNEPYADAWAKTGKVLAFVAEDVGRLLVFRSQMFYPFVAIVCKLMRVLGSPDNPDHWKDIMGYAQLVLGDIERRQALAKGEPDKWE
jgi:hypothetical protein